MLSVLLIALYFITCFCIGFSTSACFCLAGHLTQRKRIMARVAAVIAALGFLFLTDPKPWVWSNESDASAELRQSISDYEQTLQGNKLKAE